MSDFAIAGVVEGFAGKPWTWDERVAVMERCIAAGLPWYVWGPQSDDIRTVNWREPFPDDYLTGFRRLLTVGGLKLGVSIDVALGPDHGADCEALCRKVQSLVDVDIDLLMLSFRDPLPGEGASETHAAIVRWLTDQLPLSEIHVVVVPHRGASGEYLSTLSNYLDFPILIGWVHGDDEASISAVGAEAFADRVDGRPIVLIDNVASATSATSATSASRNTISLLPPSGRDPLLCEVCAGYLLNAETGPASSLPSLMGVASWIQNGSTDVPWDDFDDPVNLAVMAQACDGRELYRLAERAIQTDDSDDLWWWMERIENVRVVGAIGEEIGRWVLQAQAEASVSLLALELLEIERGDPAAAELCATLASQWPNVIDAARSSAVSVFGVRKVDPHQGPSLDSNAQSRNVTDLLCRAALARHGR